jgi:hypothetical protein
MKRGFILVLKMFSKISLNDFKNFYYKFKFKLIHVTNDDFVCKIALGSRICNEIYICYNICFNYVEIKTNIDTR